MSICHYDFDMLTDDVLSQKKLNCIDLVIVALTLEKAGIKYRINGDGSLTIYNVDYALAQNYGDHRVWGRVGDIYIDGHFDVVTDYPELILMCNEYSTRIIPDV